MVQIESSVSHHCAKKKKKVVNLHFNSVKPFLSDRAVLGMNIIFRSGCTVWERIQCTNFCQNLKRDMCSFLTISETVNNFCSSVLKSPGLCKYCTQDRADHALTKVYLRVMSFFLTSAC